MISGCWPEYSQEEIKAVQDVLKSGAVNYWTGDHCRKFEREYAEHCGVDYAIAMANGSVTLDVAMEVLGIGPDDDVIVTPRSFVASASCVVRAGARPVFADVDCDSQNITAETIAAVLTPKTRAVIPVHHAGWPCDMEPILQLARDHGLFVIEDCAQAHGAMYQGRPVGSFGDFGSFSFCQDKIITTGGEGGMLVTRDEKLWRRAWSIKDHGKDFDAVHRDDHPPGYRWLHKSVGTNYRMTEMQAAIGRIQLRRLSDWHRARTENARVLSEALAQYAALRVAPIPDHVEHAFYRLYTFLERRNLADGWSRNRIMSSLTKAGIPISVGGCSEIYREHAYASRGLAPSTRLPVAAELSESSLAFLVHPTLTPDDLARTLDAIHAVFRSASS